MEVPRNKWLVGWRAAKANLLPGLILQALMLAVLLAYYFSPAFKELLQILAEKKARLGFLYSGVSGVVAGSFIPELMRVLVFQKGRVNSSNWRNLMFTTPFWGYMSMQVDFFYRLQAQWFGDEATLAAVIPQVLVDQFVYTPFVAAPLTVWAYEWRNSGGNWPAGWWKPSYYMDRIAPTLLANWVVWIPVVSILYTLPETVQIPLFVFALALWVMIFTWMSEERPTTG